MKRASQVWHGLLVVVILASLVIQVTLTAMKPEAYGPGGVLRVEPAVTRFIWVFSFFTIQSNVLALVAAVSLLLHPGREGRLWRVIRLDALVGIIITGLVFATVLAGSVHPTGAGRWSNLGFHYIAPWWALLGWLVFGPRPRIDGRTLLWAFAWPAAWIGYTLAHGAVTGWYPYPFTDVTKIGYPATLRNLLFIVVIAVFLGAVLRLLDTRLPAHTPPPAAELPAQPREVSEV